MELTVKQYFDTLQYNLNQNIFNVSLIKSLCFNHSQNSTLATWGKKKSETKECSFLIPEYFTGTTTHTPSFTALLQKFMRSAQQSSLM